MCENAEPLRHQRCNRTNTLTFKDRNSSSYKIKNTKHKYRFCFYAPNGWRLSCERLLAGRKEPCSVQRRSTAQRTNERFPPAALGSFKRWLGGAASHAAVDQPDRPRNARRGPPDLRKPAQALGLRQSARGVGPRARAAGTRRAGCGRRRCGGRSCRARRRDSRRRCVPRRWHR